MFGISGMEFLLVLFFILVFMGPKRIPEIARTLGRFIRQVKHATNDIKSEIQRSAEDGGLDTRTFVEEVNKVKQEVEQSLQNAIPETDVVDTIQKTKEDIENLTGPIKRQH